MIRVENLTKYYGKHLAVDNISFKVEKGEIVGLLGPNAAGKTTTMRILTGFLAPTRGNVWVADNSVLTHSLEARRHIGYLPEIIPLYTDMTVRAYLDFLARLRGMAADRIKGRVGDVIDLCQLEKYADVIIGKLSKGYRQRVALAQALVAKPKVVILDEPTIGLDPVQIKETRQMIRSLAQTCTVLLSTHILSEVVQICSRVLIISSGKLLADDYLKNLVKDGKSLEDVYMAITESESVV